MYGAVCYGGSCYGGTSTASGDVQPCAVAISNSPVRSWFVGAPWTLTIAITDLSNGLPVDPDTVKVVVVGPGDEEATLLAARATEGGYSVEFTAVTSDGLWHAYAYAIAGGEIQGIGETEIRALPAPVPA